MSARKYAMSSLNMSDQAKIRYFLDNMAVNKAFRHPDPEGEEGRAELEGLRARYRQYRKGWRGIPDEAIERSLGDTFVAVMRVPPSSVDIEVAAVCDLACPFCYRQHMATPDKIMSDALCYEMIDQAAELGVPSIKLNWRGEPLLYPNLPRFVAYAKSKGILEVSINTNAVTLTPEKSRALIEAGLDVMIFSFDGGTAETYERMRVGRFKDNRFAPVYENIVTFAGIRSELGAAFPMTRVQMILIGEAYNETRDLCGLFDGIIDDIMVKAYSERGGKFEELTADEQRKIQQHFNSRGVALGTCPSNVEFWKDAEGDISYATGRLPCQQIFQRLMVSYDGTVHMCCYDWAAEHPVGYVSATAYQRGMEDYAAVVRSVKRGARGFELLSDVAMPNRYMFPAEKVQTLSEIWDGTLLNEVREAHIRGRVDEVPICRKCPLRETYRWERVD